MPLAAAVVAAIGAFESGLQVRWRVWESVNKSAMTTHTPEHSPPIIKQTSVVVTQRALDATYADLSEEGLKALRRKLGLSKQRLEWSAAMHRVVARLGGGGGGGK